MPFICCSSTGFHESLTDDELGASPVRFVGGRLGAAKTKAPVCKERKKILHSDDGGVFGKIENIKVCVLMRRKKATPVIHS